MCDEGFRTFPKRRRIGWKETKLKMMGVGGVDKHILILFLSFYHFGNRIG